MLLFKLNDEVDAMLFLKIVNTRFAFKQDGVFLQFKFENNLTPNNFFPFLFPLVVLLCGKVRPHGGSLAQPFLMASPAPLTRQPTHITLGYASSFLVHHAFINIHATPNSTGLNLVICEHLV